MLDNQGFDLWADGYDQSVGLADEDETYPFAGYRAVLNHIYNKVLKKTRADVLDIGFGTGALTAQLYAKGYGIWGVDFSRRMIELARVKMPDATLLEGDFSQGLPHVLTHRKYDFILATYSLHHLTDEEKVRFITNMRSLLREEGEILVGDVAFENRAALEACARENGQAWDEEEFYFVYDEIAACFKEKVTFEKLSHCAGVLTWRK